MEWSDRLTGLSIVSLSIAAIIIFGSVEDLWQKLPIGILAAVILLSTLPLSTLEMKRVFSNQEYSDFKELATHVEISSNSVIVARHGVEYLSAWEFGTDVVLETYYESADLSSYDSVYYIQELSKTAPGNGGGGNGGGGNGGGGNGGGGNGGGGNGQKPAQSPNGKRPPEKGAKEDISTDLPKTVEITGETIYSNSSFALVKVR
jgi:uncharacterized membrane protein YgcG